MLELNAKIRKTLARKSKILRKAGLLPGVLYGSGIKNSLPLEINLKTFEKVFKESGESSLISLKVEGEKKDNLVLIHDLSKDPLTEKFTHVDFYQPNLEKEIEAKVPLIFEGEALAVKDLGGTLVKNISEIRVKAKPQNLPKEIKLGIEKLKTFEDSILIGDLNVPEGVKILREAKDIVAFVAVPEKIEEELAKPVEEKVEEVKKVETKKKEEAVAEEVPATEGKPKK